MRQWIFAAATVALVGLSPALAEEQYVPLPYEEMDAETFCTEVGYPPGRDGREECLLNVDEWRRELLAEIQGDIDEMKRYEKTR